MGWNDFDDEDSEQLPKPQTFVEEDYNGKSILSQPYQGSPAQKALIEKSLRDRYSEAANNDDVDAAEAKARRGNMVASAFQGLGDYVTADAQARGGKGMRDITGGVQQAGAQRVAEAQGARKARMDNVLEGDRLTQLEKDRARQTTDQAFQDKERGQKEKGWEVDDAYNDPGSPQSKALRDQYGQMFPDLAKTPGFKTMSANDLKAGLSDLLKLKEQLAQRKSEADSRLASLQATRDQTQAIRDQGRQDKADDKTKKEGDYQSSVKIPGLEVEPGYRPTPEAAKTVRTAKTAHDDLQGALNALDDITMGPVGEDGKRKGGTGTNMVGPDSNTQESLVAGMRAKLKDLESLGALSASDFALLDQQLPDPTSVKENAKGLVGADSYEARSKAFREQLKRALQSTATNNGYKTTEPRTDAAGRKQGAVHGSDLPD